VSRTRVRVFLKIDFEFSCPQFFRFFRDVHVTVHRFILVDPL